MIKRTLQEINDDIKFHKEAIKLLEKEIEDFRAACPHPDNFKKVERKSYDDEYGTIEGYHVTTTCLLCGHKDFKDESVERNKYR